VPRHWCGESSWVCTLSLRGQKRFVHDIKWSSNRLPMRLLHVQCSCCSISKIFLSVQSRNHVWIVLMLSLYFAMVGVDSNWSPSRPWILSKVIHMSIYLLTSRTRVLLFAITVFYLPKHSLWWVSTLFFSGLVVSHNTHPLSLSLAGLSVKPHQPVSGALRQAYCGPTVPFFLIARLCTPL